MAIGVYVAQRLRCHALVRQIFIRGGAIAAMAIDADIHSGMTAVPCAFVSHRVLLRMTSRA
jgi:hypothetical protein